MRGLKLGTLVLALVAAPIATHAETWPDRPVTLVVPYAPGGTMDLAARVIGRELSDKLGQQFVVESKGGAGGALGAAAVAKSKPDGYTLLITANGPSVLNKMLYASLPYDPDTDFAPVSLISNVPLVFVVNPKSPVNDLRGLVAYAKQKKDAMTLGHPGVGTSAHLAALWFASLAGINIIPVTYRGANPITTAILSGEIDAGLPSYIPQLQSVKMLAVTSGQRLNFLPGVPTARESGFPAIVTGAFTGLAAPAGTPPEIVGRINRILDAFLKTDEAKKQFAALGSEVIGGPPERLTERVKQEKVLWEPIVKNAGIKLQ